MEVEIVCRIYWGWAQWGSINHDGDDHLTYFLILSFCCHLPEIRFFSQSRWSSCFTTPRKTHKNESYWKRLRWTTEYFKNINKTNALDMWCCTEESDIVKKKINWHSAPLKTTEEIVVLLKESTGNSMLTILKDTNCIRQICLAIYQKSRQSIRGFYRKWLHLRIFDIFCNH